MFVTSREISGRHIDNTMAKDRDHWRGMVECVGTLMTTLQAVFFGMVLALAPCVALLGFFLWHEGIDLWPESGISVLEPNDQPSYRDAQ
jgi:hypothetical protein